MPNRNYLAGRRLEYEVKKDFEERGYHVLRTSGSHGLFDLVALRASDIILIQCKRVSSIDAHIRLEKKWKTDPPFAPYHFHATQILAVKVKGSSEIDYIST